MIYRKLLILTLLSVAVVAAGTLGAPASSFAGVSIGVAVTLPPPALPVYVQPYVPGPGYIWVPGYWAWDDDLGYYWVPGTWVLPPAIGLLWTPGYWSWDDDRFFVWVDGYWGPVVGFYGGINYGFGYTGFGYYGGYWRGSTFYYNRTVNNVNVTNITNVYSRAVSDVSPAGPSYNGGAGGTTVRPTSVQLAAVSQKRFPATTTQRQQMLAARTDPKQRATVNMGRPAIAATPRPGAFTGSGVIAAERAGAAYKAPGRSAIAGAHALTPPTARVERQKPLAAPERQTRQAPTARSISPRKEPLQDTYRQLEPRRVPQEKSLAHQPGVAPRREPLQNTYRQLEPRRVPQEKSLAHQPAAPRVERARPEARRQPHGGHESCATAQC